MQANDFDKWYVDARRNAVRDYERVRRDALAKLDARLASMRNNAESDHGPVQ